MRPQAAGRAAIGLIPQSRECRRAPKMGRNPPTGETEPPGLPVELNTRVLAELFSLHDITHPGGATPQRVAA